MMDDLLFYGPFNSISVISSQWKGSNVMLCVLEPCLWLKMTGALVAQLRLILEAQSLLDRFLLEMIIHPTLYRI